MKLQAVRIASTTEKQNKKQKRKKGIQCCLLAHFDCGDTDKHMSGFRVAYEVKESVYGKGLFATVRIAAGSLIWEYMPGVNVAVFKNEDEVRADVR